ncbi:putative interactor of constitutive active ROPs [Lupinus albus]|uniref:Putative interactor of constitutive active ROPs n=1 Tax=Lupinus albus TaxID=3870 RepID=A0A6A4N280_LUPAL|nr:putative interactor of constitutive active ROPs [Lupinus albus]
MQCKILSLYFYFHVFSQYSALLKRPSRVSELESQISQLKVDLKNLRNQLSLSESCKKQHQQDAKVYKEQLLALSVKLEDSQPLKLTASEEAFVIDPKKIAEENDDESWQWKTVKYYVLNTAIHEIQQLKVQVELIANCEKEQAQLAESLDLELVNLKQNLEESLSLMKNNFMDCHESVQAQDLVNETLKQLEAAKKTLENLRAEAAKSVYGNNNTALELEHSRARVNSLEGLVRKLVASLISIKCSHCANLAGDFNFEKEAERLKKGKDSNEIEAEIHSLEFVIEAAETKYQEEFLSTVMISNAYELIDMIKSESSQREFELEAELKGKKADIEELKESLMNKETVLKSVKEENEKLNLKLEKSMSMSSQVEHEFRMELKRLYEYVAQLKEDLMDKEATLQSISEENEMLKIEINNKLSEGVSAKLEAAKAVERDAAMKLGIVMDEAHRINQKEIKVAEKLEKAQAAKSEFETELKRVKIQSDQWRKAAEAAISMLSIGNNVKMSKRSLSFNSNYSISTTYNEDIEDSFQRKKNGNMLKKIGILCKNPLQK